jgi:hypothetical protein
MATAPTSRRLNLTRDQLATFLTDQQQIRQFELLFAIVDQIQVIVGTDFEYQADNAAATANEALAQLSALAQDTAVDNAVLNAKVQQALDAISKLAQALDLLTLAPRSELGTLATQNSDNVKITGGEISGLDLPLPVASGGTGQSLFTDGELLIGNSTGNTLTKATLTPGANITITNTAGAITIAVSGLGTLAFQNVGISGSAALAKLTALGANGSLTFANGIITAYVAPT